MKEEHPQEEMLQVNLGGKSSTWYPRVPCAPFRAWWLLALDFFKLELPFCLHGHIWHDKVPKHLSEIFQTQQFNNWQ